MVVVLVLEIYMPENNSTRNNFVSHSILINILEETNKIPELRNFWLPDRRLKVSDKADVNRKLQRFVKIRMEKIP